MHSRFWSQIRVPLIANSRPSVLVRCNRHSQRLNAASTQSLVSDLAPIRSIRVEKDSGERGFRVEGRFVVPVPEERPKQGAGDDESSDAEHDVTADVLGVEVFSSCSAGSVVEARSLEYSSLSTTRARVIAERESRAGGLSPQYPEQNEDQRERHDHYHHEYGRHGLRPPNPNTSESCHAALTSSEASGPQDSGRYPRHVGALAGAVAHPRKGRSYGRDRRWALGDI